MYQEYLFHGSPIGGLTVLKPQISLELKPRLYATADRRYAIIRAGAQLDLVREEYQGFDKPFEIAECYPNAFEKQFDRVGYIYWVDKKDFIINPDDPDEYICDHEVRPVRCETISNILSLMQEGLWLGTGGFELVYEWDSEEYWKGVRGGREGYLERKLARKTKMLEMRKEAE